MCQLYQQRLCRATGHAREQAERQRPEELPVWGTKQGRQVGGSGPAPRAAVKGSIAGSKGWNARVCHILEDHCHGPIDCQAPQSHQ